MFKNSLPGFIVALLEDSDTAACMTRLLRKFKANLHSKFCKQLKVLTNVSLFRQDFEIL